MSLFERWKPDGSAPLPCSTGVISRENLSGRPWPSTDAVADDYAAIDQCLTVLRPFYQATVELSEERRVSGSKAIPTAKMLRHVISAECAQMTPCIGATLANHLKTN